MPGASHRRILIQRLGERLLAAGGELPLAGWLRTVVPVARLRELARKFGLSPKGFRPDKAPAKVLAPLLADLRDPKRFEEVLALLLEYLGGEVAAPEDEAAPPDLGPVLRLREQELAAAREALAKAEKARTRAQERAEQLQRQLELLEAERARQSQTQTPPVTPPPGAGAGSGPAVRELQARVRELERDLETLGEAEEGLRRLLSLRTTRIRELEEQVAELSELVPKGRRRRRRPPEPEPEPDRPFALPHFTPGFYKSLEGQDRKSVEKAFQAILLYCTEGPAYPGLETKQMGGQETWSLRAGLRHRVYFQRRPDGDITVLAMADREDQHTTLRRLKER